jgi:hypothetical protein
MSTEESKLPGRRFSEDVFTHGNLAVNDGLCPARENEILDRRIFGLALAIATEPSKMGQLRQMLVHLQEQQILPQDFSTWAIEQIDQKVMSMALEYAHDAEVILQILSFKGGTFDCLMHDIEDLYRQAKICQRVYARVKLLLRVNEPPQQ